MNRTMWAALALALHVVILPARGDDLYDERTYRPLAADQRAYRAGDALTVLIFETSSAAAQAEAGSRRHTEVGGRVASGSRDHAGSLGLQQEFDGHGSVQRSGRLLGQITVTVTRVDPNGDLWVRGEQLVAINDDQQQIRVEGRARVQDISAANTVPSSRLADARISYAGAGPVENSKKPGLLTRLFSWLGV
ncbi:flagellar basal body L-ring protein FlgH [Massilia endophytica]|uniref:flagellar basal body L-ring protein FlgH n=1 Tax=Massilia endophytica TaxID=2899220 RepID=UPI001E535087|nr:flagellar basal body L-ring protein FlgH [Massilia endophytica]UGQ47962.1 flagellar basal body L-ring protein FlgH [Massilia endophytica]